jgi:hypothetical protein
LCDCHASCVVSAGTRTSKEQKLHSAFGGFEHR